MEDGHEHEHHEQNAMQSYFDWQVTTIMLARDLHEPIDDTEAAEVRRKQVEQEVSAFTLAIVPKDYQQDAARDWPPDLMRLITRETLRRAAEIGRPDQSAAPTSSIGS